MGAPSSAFDFLRRGPSFAKAFAGKFDPIGVMDDAIEDSVGDRRHPDHLVPAIDRDLACDDERTCVVTVFDDFQEVARLVGVERLRPPIIEDQELGACDRAQQPAVAPVAMRDGKVGEQSGHAVIEHGDILPAGFLAQARRPASSCRGRLPR